jgi:hypothetical protein
MPPRVAFAFLALTTAQLFGSQITGSAIFYDTPMIMLMGPPVGGFLSLYLEQLTGSPAPMNFSGKLLVPVLVTYDINSDTGGAVITQQALNNSFLLQVTATSGTLAFSNGLLSSYNADAISAANT